MEGLWAIDLQDFHSTFHRRHHHSKGIFFVSHFFFPFSFWRTLSRELMNLSLRFELDHTSNWEMREEEAHRDTSSENHFYRYVQFFWLFSFYFCSLLRNVLFIQVFFLSLVPFLVYAYYHWVFFVFYLFIMGWESHIIQLHIIPLLLHFCSNIDMLFTSLSNNDSEKDLGRWWCWCKVFCFLVFHKQLAKSDRETLVIECISFQLNTATDDSYSTSART